MSGSWRVAFRLARREVVTARRRSALVAAMVGVPVLLITGMVVLLRTIDGAGDESTVLSRQLGSADARIVQTGRAPVTQDPFGHTGIGAGTGTAGDEPWTDAELAEATGGRVVPVRSDGGLVRTDAGAIAVGVREFDLRDPVTDGLARLTEGRAPATAGEIAVSPALAERGFTPGSALPLEVAGGNATTEVTVTGVARDPSALDEAAVIGPPGALFGPADGAAELTYLVDTGGEPVTWSRVRELNRLGLAVVSKAVLADPPADARPAGAPQNTGESSGGGLVIWMIVGCVVLEIALLAGPAFTVGARRQRRRLALLVAAGGEPGDVRRVVLAQGLLLGLGSALLGAAVAVGLVFAGRPVVDSVVGAEVGTPRVDPRDLLLIIGIGVVAAFVAAAVPARVAARQDPVAALAGRPGSVRPHRHARWARPLTGVLLVTGGLLLAGLGMGAASGGEMVVVAGTFALVAGVIMLTPVLLGLLGRVSVRWPLALRMAARDTARNQARAASVVSAILGAVIGVTALAIGGSSDIAERRRDYVPTEPVGTLTVSLPADGPARELADRVERLLPDRRAVVFGIAGGMLDETTYENVDLLIPGCPPRGDCVWAWSAATRDEFDLDVRRGVLVAGPDTVERVLGGELTEQQRTTLTGGGVLVPHRDTMRHSGSEATAHIEIRRVGDAAEPVSSTGVDLAAAELPSLIRSANGASQVVATMVLTPATVERLGVTVTGSEILVPPGESGVSAAQESAVDELARGMSPDAVVFVERGFTESFAPVWWLLAAVGGLIVLVATATGTALALDDARADHATLSAVGAAPWTRRRQAMAQAGVLSMAGAVLGVAIGAVPGIAITWPLTAADSGPPGAGGHIIDVPWTLLGLVVVAVPLVATAGAGLLTRSKTAPPTTSP